MTNICYIYTIYYWTKILVHFQFPCLFVCMFVCFIVLIHSVAYLLFQCVAKLNLSHALYVISLQVA